MGKVGKFDVTMRYSWNTAKVGVKHQLINQLTSSNAESQLIENLLSINEVMHIKNRSYL